MCSGSANGTMMEFSSLSLLELKKQQASLLFIAWDDDEFGRIECVQLRPILYALFPSEGTTTALSLREIRDAFAVAVGQPWSPKRRVTLSEVLAVVDALWASPERRLRMVRACLRGVFASVFGAQRVVSKAALVEAGRSMTGAAAAAGVAESILRSASATASCDTVDVESFCELLLPSMGC
ncbi:hypothetical protein DQ04_04011040 [Trypanosoma grayi]|uniref:hypothetical protein n=1 Tax=Trypanosoma grayi TaxID=71804 RepID=UPI0004F4313E|nr:hypothetical protein DQ04_04011040 [Trypanosoma grayi]KEG10231.1 hypothetical protein DQ04_04011040 [Trypanosoma grayi]